MKIVNYHSIYNGYIYILNLKRTKPTSKIKTSKNQRLGFRPRLLRGMKIKRNCLVLRQSIHRQGFLSTGASRHISISIYIHTSGNIFSYRFLFQESKASFYLDGVEVAQTSDKKAE